MTATLVQKEALEQEQEDLVTVSTTFINQKGKRFPNTPIAVSSVAQTSVKDMSVEAKSYYLSSRPPDSLSVFLQPQRYQFTTIGEQDEELMSDYIAVYTLARSIARQNVGFIQALAGVKRGKFLTSSINCLPTHLPRLQSKLPDSGLEEEEEEEVIQRGVFPLLHSTKIIFSEDIEIKTDELPAWRPNVIIDSYRLEDDEE
ncbi:hypothetical protein [Nodularia sp. NIES-3585]|uniref:hypothetical protein n=1 Tax=Nodularia sp. NIES-3585 TaxID=1973477 RepID=UPI000B5C9013|nr:hypothetical protein [Nodularia sp. NIES-3585]GAX36288.1 hypothetical protein NIES3585_23140 [Nodularia sp. NIES-3585]